MRKAILASLLAVFLIGIAFTDSGFAFATDGTSGGLDPTAFGEQIVVGIVLGVISAILGWLSASTPWSHSKLGYTIIISVVAALGIINGTFGGQVTNSNIIQVILAVLGTGFVANKTIQIQSKFRARAK